MKIRDIFLYIEWYHWIIRKHIKIISAIEKLKTMTSNFGFITVSADELALYSVPFIYGTNASRVNHAISYILQDTNQW